MSFQEEDRPIEQRDNSLVRLINTMIVEAYPQGVSDIHIENYPGSIKIMCDLDISERRKPQDGKINFARFVLQYRLELRAATIPTNNGLEDVVMRILSSARPMPLERPYGMILGVGPTRSGKTITLHSVLSFINVPEHKIWAAEDPVEITQPGLRQVQVNPKID